MSKMKKTLLVTIGLVAMGLGFVGVILPILPTTPFLLLASCCFVKGSSRFDAWFKGTKLYKNNLESFVTERAMTMKQKITILLFADIMLLFPLIIIDSYFMKGFILLLMLTKFYYFMYRIRTISISEQQD